jgi:apolipoprotein N-acyltransferase
VICFALLSIHYGAPTKTLPLGTTVGIITTNFKNVESAKETEYKKIFTENSREVHHLTRSLASSTSQLPDILVYPEDTRYLSNISEPERDSISTIFNNSLFVDGDLWSSKEGFYNVSLFYAPETKEVKGRGKELLLPFNEYLPYSFEKLFMLFVDEKEIDTYTRNHTYTPIVSTKTISFHGMRIGTLICSEILSFSVIDRLRKEKPDVVLFQSHLQVFHESPWFDMFLRSFTKVASAQMRTTVISSVSGAPSYTVSPYGKILLTIPTGFGAVKYEEGSR